MFRFLWFSFIKSLSIFFILILSNNITSAQNSSIKWNLKPYIGIHQSNFDWSIAGNAAGKNPNVLSELIWKDLKGPVFGFDIKYNITSYLSVKAVNQYGNITKGNTSDTDYADDNRQNAYYNDKFNSNKGHLFNSSLQLSYKIVRLKKVTIAPLAGISYNQQQFYLLENTSSPESSGLNSTYQTKYKGFDFGTEVVFKTRFFSVGAEVSLGFYNYSAKANWNLIPDFEKPVSFIQKANSFASAGKINLSIPVNKHIQIEIDYKIDYIKTYSGIDRAYFNSKPDEETLFNGARFKKNAVLFGFNFMF